MKRSILYFILIFNMWVIPVAYCSQKQGVLIWFYILEVKDGMNEGNVYTFKQTAGVNYPPHTIHEILPLTPQSKVTLKEDNNWYLDFKPEKLTVTKERPLYLGQILYLTNSQNISITLSDRDNIPLKVLSYNSSFDNYLKDRNDLLLNHSKIIKVRDQIIKDNPLLLDYLIAVDRFVHKQLDYGKCKRPNTAVDLLTFTKGQCGEYAKLKQALLRSAGIPTRDVYATRTEPYGPGIGDDGSSMAHVWLQAYIPEIGWIAIPSTRKLNDNYDFLKYQGGYHTNGYYLRAIDLYRYEEEIQKKVYTYNALQRSGGIRGNGMFFEIEYKYFQTIQLLTNQILDYHSIPDKKIFDKIETVPIEIQPLLYWFCISVPDKDFSNKAVMLFLQSINKQPHLKLKSFLIVSPQAIKNRIIN